MNKPVAWIDKDILDATHIIKAVVRREQDEQHTIPLYTHPVKELTDEEITDIGYKFGEMGLNMQMIRAILRKAQEK